MNGWETACVMILAGFVLYLFVHMVVCFVERLSGCKGTESNGNCKIKNDECNFNVFGHVGFGCIVLLVLLQMC